MSRRFVLLDRDGTINEERHHLSDPGEVALIPGSAEALTRLRDELGMGIVIVTNQAEIGRGNLTVEALQRIHERLLALLATTGAGVDAIEVCPHRPEEGCDCRKPATGLARAAAERFGFDLADSFVIGDHASDMGLGRAVGATTVLVRTGHGVEEAGAAAPLADHVADDLAGAVAIIAGLLGEEGRVDPIQAQYRARAYLADAASAMAGLTEACLEDILAAAEILVTSFRSGGTLLICGNGGSAADAQHLATEFVSALTLDHLRPAMRAIALTTDTSALTAIANDFGVERMFSRQVEAIGNPGDVLLAISTSGNSANILAAAEAARTRAMPVIALTGASGGRLAPMADVAVRVPSTATAHIQECHLAIEQLLALLAERALHPDPS
ncbi:MAG: HAD-IIIA family hydrolase [Actinomycetota bacterium]